MTNLTATSETDNVNDTITAYETAVDEMESSEVNKRMEDTMDSSVVNQSMDVSVGEEYFENAETETVQELIEEGEEGSHDSSLDEMHLDQEESGLDQEQDETSLEEFDDTPDPDETGLDLTVSGSDTNMESEGDETGEGYDAEDENTLEEILASVENSPEQPEGGEEKSDDEMEGVNETSQDQNSEGVDGNNFPVEALDDSSIQSSIEELNREKEKDPKSSKHLSVKVDSGNQVVISVDTFLDLHPDPSNDDDTDSDFEYNTCDDLDNLDSAAEVTVSDSCTSLASLNEKDIEDHDGVAKVVKEIVHELAWRAVNQVEKKEKKGRKESAKRALEEALAARQKKASRKTPAQRRSGKQVKSKVKIEETEEIEFLDDGATPSLPGKKPNSSPKSSPAANKPEESYSPDTKKLRDECASRPSKVMVFRVYFM